MTNWDIVDRPNRFPWPPILLGTAILIGFALRQALPLNFANPLSVQIIGALFIAGALALDIWSSLTFRKARTTILPHRGSQALVTSGPFTFSRNPIYLGNLMILFGLGLLAGSLWHLILIPALGLAISRLAITREEQHLKARFPVEWAQYAGKVRRWI